MWISEAAALVLHERERQIKEEGYALAHDDEHTEGQLALLAAAYALSSRDSTAPIAYEVASFLGESVFKWGFNPKSPIQDLTRAGALILAELERRLRAENFVSVTTKEDLDREGA